MLVTLLRTVMLYATVILGLRVMGKRQIGDMQPNELVTTILISDIATIPIQDIKQPVINGVLAILTLVCLEVTLSVVMLKWDGLRRVIDGRPTVVIRRGEMDQKAMRALRLTVDDLLERLRQQQVFNVTDVACAIVETNGELSVLLKPEQQPATAGQIGVAGGDGSLPAPVICDGRLRDEFMDAVGMTRVQLRALLDEAGVAPDELFLMTVDEQGRMAVVRREAKP